jgi:lipoprotein LprG
VCKRPAWLPRGFLRQLPRFTAAIAIAGVAALFAAGCSGHSAPAKVNAETLLQQAKATVNATQSVHFVLTSQGVSGGTTITGGEGDLARPDQLQATFTVTIAGSSAPVKVVSKGGVFAAQLPFQTKFTRTTPTALGLTNPSVLLDPNRGLSNLLTAGTGATVTGQERVAGELLYEVTSTVPGSSVPVLPNANPSQSVTMVAAINPTNYQVRQLALTGPFTSQTDSTYVVTLTKYNEPVSITLPP